MANLGVKLRSDSEPRGTTQQNHLRNVFKIFIPKEGKIFATLGWVKIQDTHRKKHKKNKMFIWIS